MRHLIRRSVVRAASSSTTSVRTLNTSTPFALRSKTQQSSIVPSAFRRYSDDAEKSFNSESVRTSDGESSAVNAAINSASESSRSSSFGDTASQSYTPQMVVAEADSEAVADAVGMEAIVEVVEDTAVVIVAHMEETVVDIAEDVEDMEGGREMRGGARPFEPRPAPSPSNGIYVGNLVFDCTAADLEKLFVEFGTISKVTLATDARGLSKGFGYVEFENVEQAAKAIEAKNETIIEGRRLVVNYMNKRREGRSGEAEPSKTLFIGNLAFEMSDADLNKLFRDIRNVIDVRVAIDRRTGQPRGFAHADFVDVESAIKGKEALVGKEVYGRQLRIDFSAGSREARGDGGAPKSRVEGGF
ncbi:hypothetical protein BKA61DRAFT_664210 [Leptodontidium sp. MPI-SDFR-AT-0119]|nr:hypothetical protein BKA61DRAFT_664210 [Leptodontidium sp. MPI-SDFR-AT-0119]